MNKSFFRRVMAFGMIFLFIVSGCAVSGPLLKPNQDHRREYVYKHPELSEEIKQAILKGKVIEGMTKKDVTAVWGDPSDILNLKYPRHYKENEEGWYYKGTLLQTLAPNCTITFLKGRVENIYCGGWLEK